jgi:electron transfer flavoprotein alpha subunit
MRVFILAEDIHAANNLADWIRTMAVDIKTIYAEETAADDDVTEIAVIAHSDELLHARADVLYRLCVPEGLMLEDAAHTMAKLISDYKPSAVFVQPTRRMRLLAGKTAALLGAAAIGEIVAYDNDGSLRTMAYGGLAVRTEKATTATSIMFVHPSALPDVEVGDYGAEAVTVSLEFIAPVRTVRLLSDRVRERTSIDLTNAERIVGVGRGVATRDDMQIIEGLAATLGAEVGCTRPIAEEEKWLPREAYIGISGAMLSPQVYLAIGLSGQAQHMVGINRSRMIFAINKNKNAPIFKQADYGIVADLYKVVPALAERLCNDLR